MSGSRQWMLSLATALYLGGALVLLLWPSVGSLFTSVFDWLKHAAHQPYLRPSFLDVPANIALFFPLGLLAVLWLRRFWLGFGLSVLLSSGVELAQFVLPGRDASLRDVASNALGAALGALVARAIVRRAGEPRRHDAPAE